MPHLNASVRNIVQPATTFVDSNKNEALSPCSYGSVDAACGLRLPKRGRSGNL